MTGYKSLQNCRYSNRYVIKPNATLKKQKKKNITTKIMNIYSKRFVIITHKFIILYLQTNELVKFVQVICHANTIY